MSPGGFTKCPHANGCPLASLGEIPAGLDHPTFDERIHYLEEYWGNEMAFAYASFNQGLQHVEQATTIEGKDLNAAAALLKEAIADEKSGQVLGTMVFDT